MFSTTYVVVYSEMSMAVESTCGIAVTLINLYLKLEVFFIPDGHPASICVSPGWNFTLSTV